MASDREDLGFGFRLLTGKYDEVEFRKNCNENPVCILVDVAVC